jgi:hypothetical protein
VTTAPVDATTARRKDDHACLFLDLGVTGLPRRSRIVRADRGYQIRAFSVQTNACRISNYPALGDLMTAHIFGNR